MKIKKIESLCKNAKRLMIFNARDVQWISDGRAVYPLYGLPRLTPDNVLTMFDVPEDKRGKIYVDEKTELPPYLDISDAYPGEKEIAQEKISFNYYGKTLLPFRGSQGVIFLDKKYLEPLTDAKHGFTLFERVFADGRSYVAVKDGMLLSGIILPDDAASAELADLLVNVGELVAVSAENKAVQLSISDEKD